MFGDQDDQPAQQDSNNIPDESIDGALKTDEARSAQLQAPPAATAEGNDNNTVVKPSPAEPPVLADDTPAAPTAATNAIDTADTDDEPGPSEDNEPAWQHPGSPLDDKSDDKPGPKPDHDQISDIISPAGGFPKRPSYQYPAGSTGLSDSADTAPDLDDSTRELVDIKQQALGELIPLIDKLDLPPEEKFRTIMMMIQASDDESLVKAAYAAAHSIEDEKARAQALLDIVNEVNYFTSPHPDQPATETEA